MAKSKKLGMGSIITLAILAATAIAAIVGLFVDYVSVTGTVLGQSTSEGIALFDMEDTWGTISIIAAIAAVVLAVLDLVMVIGKALGCPKVGKLCKILGLLAVVIGIFALIAAFVFASKTGANGDLTIGGSSLASIKCTPAIGAWLVGIGSIVNGVFTVLSK